MIKYMFKFKVLLIVIDTCQLIHFFRRQQGVGDFALAGLIGDE